MSIEKYMNEYLLKKFIIKNKENVKEKSLLSFHQNEIKNYLKKLKSQVLSYIENDNNIELLDNEFRKILDTKQDDFDTFLKYLIKNKFTLLQQKSHLLNFSEEIKDYNNFFKFPSIIYENSLLKNILPNVINHDDFTFNMNSNQIRVMTKMIKAEYFDDKKKQDALFYTLSNTLYYHSMDLSLPTIGNIYISPLLETSLSHMFLKICNGDKNILSYLPLHIQNIKESIVSMVLNKNESDYEFKKKVMSNVLNNVDISFDKVMKEKNKMKKVYIIPYVKNEISNNTFMKYEIQYDKYITKSSVSEVIEHNNSILRDILQLIDENPKNIDLPNVKDVLGLYVYYVITLFYDIYHLYFMEINQILYEYSQDKRFENDTLDLGMKYVDKCIESLQNFKKILLNNFYDFFLPAKLTRAYGIKINDNGFVVCASKLVNENDFIIKKYPFQLKYFESGTNKFQITKDSLMSINNFIVGKKRTHDLYDNNEKLCIGFYIPNEPRMKEVFQFYKKYVNVLNVQIVYNLFIEKVLYNTLLQEIPEETFKTINDELKKLEGKNDNKRISNKIIVICYKYLVKAVKLLNEMKGKKYNESKIKNMQEKDEGILLSSFYYNYVNKVYEKVKKNRDVKAEHKKYLLGQLGKAFQKIESKI